MYEFGYLNRYPVWNLFCVLFAMLIRNAHLSANQYPVSLTNYTSYSLFLISIWFFSFFYPSLQDLIWSPPRLKDLPDKLKIPHVLFSHKPPSQLTIQSPYLDFSLETGRGFHFSKNVCIGGMGNVLLTREGLKECEGNW